MCEYQSDEAAFGLKSVNIQQQQLYGKRLMNRQQMFGSPEASSRHSDAKKQKICIKFNRKQENARTDRKKVDSLVEGTERICFISPQKTNGYSPRHPAIAPLASPNVLKVKENFAIPKDQSYILTYESPRNIEQKMNDSMLSLMDELKGENERRHEHQVQEYLQEISNLREEIDGLQYQNSALKAKVKDFELFQEFLIERQTYISEVTDKNIYLSEELHKIQKEKERISVEFKQLHTDYTHEHQMYEDYIKILKQQRQTSKGEFDMMMRLNVELNEKLQQFSSKRKQKIRHSSTREATQTPNEGSPIKQSKGHRTKTSVFANQKSQEKGRYQFGLAEEFCDTLKTKQTDLSELNVKSMDEYSILQKLNEQSEPCDCKDIIKQLRKKISYHEIEIDILKRIKISSEKTKSDNQKLKNQNKKLLAKIEQLCNKPVKICRKRSNDSDSSLQLSLSPSKHEK